MSRSLLHDDHTVLKAFLYVLEQNLARKAQKTETPCADAWLRKGGADGWVYSWNPLTTFSGNWAVSSVGRMRLSYYSLVRRPKMRSWVRAPGGPSILESCSKMPQTLRSLWVSLTIYFFVPIRVCQSLQRTSHTSKLYILFVCSLTKTREV